MNAFVEAGCPPGVLNLVLGKGAELGEVLTTHPSISLITFTGSNTVGRDVQAAGVAANKRVQLEMGGKNPAVVLADADLEHAAEQIARAAFLSAGQKCTATSRVIVETDAEHDLVEYLTERANDWTVGDPLAEQTMIGPLASAAQLARVDAHLRQALDDGAVAAAGGPRHHPDGDGYFASPTVLVGAHDQAPIAQEEIFGPVITVLPAADFERAIALANGTPFGLAASLFTSDLGRALVFTRDARAGVIKVNQETAGLEYQVPFGGMGASSSGSREQGKAAREFFTEWKTVYMDPPP